MRWEFRVRQIEMHSLHCIELLWRICFLSICCISVYSDVNNPPFWPNPWSAGYMERGGREKYKIVLSISHGYQAPITSPSFHYFNRPQPFLFIASAEKKRSPTLPHPPHFKSNESAGAGVDWLHTGGATRFRPLIRLRNVMIIVNEGRKVWFWGRQTRQTDFLFILIWFIMYFNLRCKSYLPIDNLFCLIKQNSSWKMYE